MSRDLTSDDYAALAKSYEVEPPRRDEMVGEPVLNPRADREHDAITGEGSEPGTAPEEPRG